MDDTDLPAADRRYTAETLSALSGIPRRTIRYYIQLGLVDRPVGETRAAYYGWKHLGQLLRIRELTEAGVSLERIRSILLADASTPVELPLPSVPGSVVVQSHVHIAPGVQLVIDPARSDLSAEALRVLVRSVVDALDGARNHES